MMTAEQVDLVAVSRAFHDAVKSATSPDDIEARLRETIVRHGAVGIFDPPGEHEMTDLMLELIVDGGPVDDTRSVEKDARSTSPDVDQFVVQMRQLIEKGDRDRAHMLIQALNLANES